jgi:hypothetical protein
VTLRPLPRRDGGRTCGCDPAADHTCGEHLAHVDVSETEIAGILITGPVRNELLIRGAGLVYLSRFDAEDLARELLRRLSARS